MTYSVPTGAQVAVDEGTRIDAGSIIPKRLVRRQNSGYYRRPSTGAELFEAQAQK